MFLLFVHDVFSHAGEFDDALELELTPVAAHFGVLHGRCEFGCFLLQGSGERRERTDAGVQATRILDTFVFELVELLVEPSKLLANGCDKVVHGFLLLCRFGRSPSIGLGLQARVDIDEFAHRGGQRGIGDVSGAVDNERIGSGST
ncbi:unannotated protein [freshwater metagenome]|uniref:Unannotated protein n=1 Tax=freshwater metagenome TaxID=449393 RepID=A0A6J6CPW4_9ZZZZ